MQFAHSSTPHTPQGDSNQQASENSEKQSEHFARLRITLVDINPVFLVLLETEKNGNSDSENSEVFFERYIMK